MIGQINGTSLTIAASVDVSSLCYSAFYRIPGGAEHQKDQCLGQSYLNGDTGFLLMYSRQDSLLVDTWWLSLRSKCCKSYTAWNPRVGHIQGRVQR